jgi:hypothetical protein
MPDPQGAGELLRLGSSVGGDRKTDRAELPREVVPYANDHRSTMDRRYSTEQQRIILAIYKSALELERATAAEMSRETAMMRESLAETR